MAGKHRSNEIQLTRLYDAPLKVVWEAFNDAEQVQHWWGPRGFTLTTHGKDFKPGGHWSYTMHGPDGTNYENKTKYLEVEKYRKLVYDHGGNEDLDRAPLFRVTALFSEAEGRTKLEMTMALPTPEAAEETRKFIKKAGGDSTWDRFGEYLAEKSGKSHFVINRSFDAPLEVLFQMWTDPRHLSQWVPPAGLTMEYLRKDIRPGGSAHYVMTNGQMKMYGRADYLEIERPDRLVYTQQFCDEKEKVARHPMAPTWPETMLSTVELHEEGAGRTRVTVTWEPHGKVTKEELDTFLKARAGMTQGWTGSFDKLDAHLEKAR